MDTRPPEAFPNFEDQKALRRVIRAGNYSTLTDDQLWRHHAYDYAWRRIYLGDRNAFKAGDEDGKWFDAANVDLAEQMYRRLADRPRPHQITPADEAEAAGDLERAARYRAQDRERAELLAALRRLRQELPDGKPTPEEFAYVTCCMRQVRANLGAFEDRTAAIKGDRGAMARVQAALGVSAEPTGPAPEIPPWVTE